jgi:ribokinase
MARHYDVITVGNVRMDAYMNIHDPEKELHKDTEHHGVCFRQGEKIRVDRFDFLLGGNAANVAVGLARLGLKATVCAETGDDEFSIRIRNTLAKENIERLLINQVKGGATKLSVVINFAGDRTIFAEERDQENDLSLEEVEAEWIYLTSLARVWDRPYKMVLDFAKEHGVKLAFNPGELQIREGKEIIEKVLENCEILFVNKEEAELILFNHYAKKIVNNENYIKDLCEALQKLGPKTVVITNGKRGAYVFTPTGGLESRDPESGKVVERTGAGDAFASGFLAAIVQGLSVEKAIRWGSLNASSVVGDIGAQRGLLTKHEMEERME